MKQVIRYFTSGYERSALLIRKKATALLVLNFFMTIATLLYALFSILSGTSLVQILLFGSAPIALAASVLALKTGRYRLAVNLTLVTVFIVLSASSFVSTDRPAVQYNSYIQALIFILVLVCLVGIQRHEVLAALGTGIISSSVYFFLHAWPARTSTGQALDQLVSGLLLFGISAVVTFFLMKMINQTIARIEKETEINRERVRKLNEVIDSSRKGMQIGDDLIASTTTLQDNSQEIDRMIQSITGEVGSLQQQLDTSSEANSEIIKSTVTYKQQLVEQSAHINETSSAIEQMTTSIKNITGMIFGKKKTIDTLLVTAETGSKEMATAVSAIEAMQQNTRNMDELIKLITVLNQQSKLLSMNAAIEAAHAGQYGRGFAVIAEEMTNFAETSHANTTMIKDTLQATIADIEASVSINQKAGDSFNRIFQEIHGLSNLLLEIISGLEEINTGTDEILNSVTALLVITEDSNSSVDSIEEMILENNQGIQTVTRNSRQIQDAIARISEQSEKIMQETRQINSIGLENISTIHRMSDGINEINFGEAGDDEGREDDTVIELPEVVAVNGCRGLRQGTVSEA
jgi:methyl-accepting chemotaxis protein